MPTTSITSDAPTNSSERKAIIFKEAARLIREKGYGATTLRELAGRAGIQGGSVYHHFSSKQEILFRIMEQTMAELIDRVGAAMAGEQDPSRKLAAAIRAHIAFHTTRLDETYITDAELRSLSPENYRHIVGMRDSYEQLYVRMIEAGVRQGQMSVPHVKITVRALLQACTGVSYWFRPEGVLTVGEIADNYLHLFFRGIAGKGKGAGQTNSWRTRA